MSSFCCNSYIHVREVPNTVGFIIFSVIVMQFFSKDQYFYLVFIYPVIFSYFWFIPTFVVLIINFYFRSFISFELCLSLLLRTALNGGSYCNNC
jgi:hypothetical protein